jgi:hypothetical protein
MEFRKRSLSRHVEYDIEKQQWDESEEDTNLFCILWNDFVNLIRKLTCCSNRVINDHGSKVYNEQMSAV